MYSFFNHRMVAGIIVLSIILSRGIMYLTFVILYKSWDFSLFIEKMNIWDVGWYQEIARNLYLDCANHSATGEASWAFFPLYPMGVRLIWKVTGIDLNYIASFLSTLFLGIAEYVGYKYIVLTRKDARQGIGYICFLSFGAYSFYFSIFYTESLYLLLLTCAFYYLKKEEYLKMGAAGMFLSMTRNTGIFFCFVVLAFWIKEYLKLDVRSIIGFFKKTIKSYKLILGTMMIPFGFFSYMLYLYFKVGDSFAFLHVQRAWNRQNLGIFDVAKEALLAEFPPNYFGVCFCIYIFLLGVLIFKHRRIEEAVFPLITLLVSANSSLGSTPRYMIGSFTMLLAFTDEWKGCTKINKVLIFAGVFVFEIACIQGWLNYSAVLV